MKTRDLIRTAMVIAPSLAGVIVVMAKAPTEIQSLNSNPQTLSDGLILIGSFLVSIAVKYIQTSYSNVKATAQEAKKVADDTPTKWEFKRLQDDFAEMEEKHKKNIDNLTEQIDMLVANYKSVAVERDRMRDNLAGEIQSHRATKQELQEERRLTADLFRKVETLEARMKELEQWKDRAEDVTKLADKIVRGIDGLVNKALPLPPATELKAT